MSTQARTHSADKHADLDFYFDPVCPFAWMTSKWVRMVAVQREYTVEWRFIILRLINSQIDYDSHFAAGYEEGRTSGLRQSARSMRPSAVKFSTPWRRRTNARRRGKPSLPGGRCSLGRPYPPNERMPSTTPSGMPRSAPKVTRHCH